MKRAGSIGSGSIKEFRRPVDPDRIDDRQELVNVFLGRFRVRRRIDDEPLTVTSTIQSVLSSSSPAGVRTDPVGVCQSRAWRTGTWTAAASSSIR